MKILALMLVTLCSLYTVNSFVTPIINDEIELNKPSMVKVVNDTKKTIKIHTGSAHVSLNNGGGSTSVSCETGRKISYSDGSKPTGTIFVIDETMCGKTVKLSTYIK